MPQHLNPKRKDSHSELAAAQPQPISAAVFGVLAGAIFILGLLLTNAHSAATLFVNDQYGLVALGALFSLLAGMFAILALAIEIPPDS